MLLSGFFQKGEKAEEQARRILDYVEEGREEVMGEEGKGVKEGNAALLCGANNTESRSSRNVYAAHRGKWREM